MSNDTLNGGLSLLTKRIERRTKMAKLMQKSVILTVVFGLLLAAAAAPSAMAQDRCRRRGYTSTRYYNDNYRDNYRRDRSRRDYYNDYYDRQDTKGKAVRAHCGWRRHRRSGRRFARRRKGRGGWRNTRRSGRLHLPPAEGQQSE